MATGTTPPSTIDASRPLLLLDVDGVLNPFLPDCPDGFSEHEFFPEDDEPVRLAAVHGEWLRELAHVYEIAASGWGHDANRVLCPFFGIPELPLVPLPAVPFEPREKVPAIAAFVAERPAAWVDDLISQEAREWAAARRAPTLLLEVDSALGLTRTGVDELLRWATALGELSDAGPQRRRNEPRPERPGSVGVPSRPRAVEEVNHAVAETALVQQFEL